MSFTIIPAYLINFPSIFDPSFYLECGFGCHLWMAPCVTLITCHIYLTHMTFCSFLSPFIFGITNTGPMAYGTILEIICSPMKKKKKRITGCGNNGLLFFGPFDFLWWSIDAKKSVRKLKSRKEHWGVKIKFFQLVKRPTQVCASPNLNF